jgi:hypothetical protein
MYASGGRSAANAPTFVEDFHVMPGRDEPSCAGKASDACSDNRDTSDDHDGDPGIQKRLRCRLVRTIYGQ